MPKRLWRYRRWNGLLILALLSAWAMASYGFGILLADVLNHIHLWGFPLGFWFATQGSILVFVVLAFVYCLLMGKLDRLLKPEE